MTISAKVVTDSVAPNGVRLTTMQLRYPKFIHGEFLTHRVLSRNSSSSRAIPVERLIQDVLDDPVIPMHWGANRPGMQAHEECNNPVLWECAETYIGGTPESNADFGTLSREDAWLMARHHAVEAARAMAKAGYHKQIVSRLIEPWCHIRTVVTATEWDNFFLLRRHPDAQPEMRALADAMWEVQQASTPTPLKPGDWHLPYVTNEELNALGDDGSELKPYDDNWVSFMQLRVGIKLSVARCARVSYLTHDGKAPDVAADLALYDRLVGAVPLHASPTEHQATPDVLTIYRERGAAVGWLHPKQHGNFRGWWQYRKLLSNEAGGTRP